ncbi:MAG: S41 family peptidase [Chthoniobacterales bacterium]
MTVFRRAVILLFLLSLSPLAALETSSDSKEKEAAPDAVPYDDIQLFARALQLIRQDYVNDKKVGYKDLIYSAMRGMMSDLDPHSQFMEPRDFKGMQEDTRSEFGGLGVMMEMKGGLLTIVFPTEGSPAFEAGLLPADQILKINGTSTEKMSVPDAVEMLRGEPGQKITLTVRRPSTREIKDYELTRIMIRVSSVKDARILSPDKTEGKKIGYVRVTQFNEPTAGELIKELDKLEKKGMEGLVLDLRYNPGGLLNSAVDVCAQFLPPNTKVVSNDGRTPAVQREYRTAGSGGKKRNYPIAILVNHDSASAAEIVAGALKDLRRAILVGETTFGKGSVQSVVALPDGSALRLTTAKYYTPARQLIHEHGVAPNIRVPMSYRQEEMLLGARRNAANSPQKDKILDNVPDVQLDRAIDALAGALIYSERYRSEMTKKNP